MAASVVESCTAVVQAASHVFIHPHNLAHFASTLEADVASVTWDGEDWHFTDREQPERLALYILALDTINFCFWPSTTDMQYDAVAMGLRKAFVESPEATTVDALATCTAESLASWLAPHDVPLLDERVRKLNELGRVLQADFGGSAVNLVESAHNSAAALVDTIAAHFPGFRDHAVYKGRQVFFYKRAQIVVADLWAAFGKQLLPAPPDAPSAPLGSFYDMHALTMFADYRVPQLLRHAGVLKYSMGLAARVDALETIPVGSEEEIEIRAATVVAVEQIKAALADFDSGAAAPAVSGLAIPGKPLSVEIDWVLWQVGERQRDSIMPHHRTLTCFY